MSSLKLYDGILESSVRRIASSMVDIDDYLNGTLKDERMGIALILPIQCIRKTYADMTGALGGIERDQYVYPFDDLHITIFDFIQGTASYEPDKVKEDMFTEISRSVLSTIPEFAITLHGITFSSGAGLIQGFDGDALVGIREEIRERLKKYGLKNDERYPSSSAHATFLRFKKGIDNPEKLLDFIKDHRTFHFGIETAGTLELVEHDWYNASSKKRVIESFHCN
jgi:hypothetical protein